MNLANKYRPSKFEDVIEQGLPVKLIKGLCDAEPFESRNILLTGPAGTGKANPLYTKILTPSGFIRMGDIKIGDEVFTHNGNIGTVSGVYPQGKKPIYRIHLSDSTYIDVSDKHINMIYFYDRLQDGRSYCKNIEIETDSLIELFDKSSKDLFIDIPFIEMDEQSTRDVFVDGKSIVESDDKDGESSIYPYILTSIRHRLEYLRGVYQTCGSVVSRDCIKITLNQPTLSEEFGILVRSIGYYLDEVIKYGDKYHHYIYASNIGIDILSESIYSKVYDEKDKFERHITDIEYIGQEECQCIMVDHEDHSYICDFGLIPTHNTTLARIVGNYLNDGSGDIIEIDAASNNGVEYMRNLIDQARSFPVNCKWKIFILDECFQKDTLISTTSGYKRICEVNPGDEIFNMTGKSYVKNVFKNRVIPSHLLLVHLDSGLDILTTSNHLFFTDDGWVEAKNLLKGDELYDYSTMCNMWEEFSNRTFKPEENVRTRVFQNLSRSTFEGTLFKLSKTRIYQDVSNMWKNLLHPQKCEFSYVFKLVRREIEITTRTFTETEKFICLAKTGLYLSDLWKAYENTEERSQTVLFKRMCEYRNNSSEEAAESCCLEILRCMWKSVCSEVQRSTDLQQTMRKQVDRDKVEGSKISRIVYSDEIKQPNGESSKCSEDDKYKIEKRYVSSATCYAWRKWANYQTSDAVEGDVRRFMDIRVSCSDKSSTEKQSNALSYQLQIRPCLSRFEDRNRGGWERPFYEIASIIRRKESQSSQPIRVESIEIYKRGDNEQSFRRYFSCEELHQEFVTMYDLEVEGHPSYYANNILVHNCHSFSNQAWQSMLKPLESGVGKSIFIFATTNPEKIPDTILSRVQSFQLSKISLDGIISRLKYVLDREKEEGRNLSYTEDGVSYIAKLANGGMRDALTMLDKCLTFSKDITIENVCLALNIPEYDQFFDLLSAYAHKDGSAIANIIDSVYNSGTNFVKWFQNFHSFIANIMKYIYLKDISKTMIPTTYLNKVCKYGPAHLSICLNLSMKLLKLNEALRYTQYLQETALSYLAFPIKEGNK